MPSLFMLRQGEQKSYINDNPQGDGWLREYLPVLLALGVCLLHTKISSRSEIVIIILVKFIAEIKNNVGLYFEKLMFNIKMLCAEVHRQIKNPFQPNAIEIVIQDHNPINAQFIRKMCDNL